MPRTIKMTTAEMTESTTPGLPPTPPRSLPPRNQRFGIATAPVSIPTFWFWFGVIAFAIGVSIHGF